MIEKSLYMLAEVSLLLGMITLFLQKSLTEVSVKGYFKTTKIAVLLSALGSVLFYNKEVFPSLFEVSTYTVMFYVLTCAIVFAWLSLSVKWFVSEDRSPFRFCELSLLALFSFNIIIKSIDLSVLFLGLSTLGVVNYYFLKFSQESEEFHNISTRYALTTSFFAVMMALAMFILTPDNWNYVNLAEFIGISEIHISMFVVLAILFFVLFLWGAAPLHFCFADVVAPAVLPVAAYLNLVPVFVLFAAFVRLNANPFLPVASELDLIYSIFGGISLIVGAIGANSSRNLRKIFAYTGVYNLGILLLLVSPFTPQSLLNSFIYLQVYILALFGVYTSFYSFKSGGNYLANLNMINGIAKVRPFISAAMLFFMVSIMGIAPFPGFIAQLTALETFAVESSYFIIFMVLFALVILMAAYLQIIRSMYFNKREVEFNRPDYGVYVYLFINMVLVAILIFKPQFLLYDAANILNVVLK